MCGNTNNATRELHAAANTNVIKPISWNQWRVEVAPQRVQTDCIGRNCSPQFSQNKRASQTGIPIVPDYLQAARSATVPWNRSVESLTCHTTMAQVSAPRLQIAPSLSPQGDTAS